MANNSTEERDYVYVETVSLQQKGDIAVLSLNHSKTHNAMNYDMADQFRAAIETIKQQEHIRVLVITGEGKSFCSGGDLDTIFSLYDRSPAQGQTTGEAFYKRFLSVRELEIPVIAAIKGHTIGAGLCLAMACDMRIASADTKLSMSFIKLGLNPGMGGTYNLPRLVGTAKALELCLLGEAIDAGEALRIGLVNHVVAPDVLMDFTLDIAGRIAANAPIAARYIKKAIYDGLERDLYSALAAEAMCQTILSSTRDYKEGLSAIREKRVPVFEGR